MATVIDTLKYADQFEQGGFAREQARSLASAFADTRMAASEDAATKADVKLLDQKIDTSVRALDQKIDTSASGLREQIARAEASSERRANRVLTGALVGVPVLVEALDLVAKHFGLG